jgi:succinate-acetate transporter protein
MASQPVVPINQNRFNEGEPRAEVFLQPFAAPSILGLYGFAGATFIVAAHMAGWYGDNQTFLYLAPFCAIFGGVAQFTAGMWAYRVRDGLATAIHGMWGAFWIAFGILNWGFASGALHHPTGAFPAFGFWFIALAAITFMGAIAAFAENLGLVSVLATLAAGSGCAAAGQIINSTGFNVAAGWLFVASAILAWYTASALMLEGSFGRPILPVFKMPHAKKAKEFNSGVGEPGVRHGQ